MHKNFYLGARLVCRHELRKQGHGLFEINQIMGGFENGLVDAAVDQASKTSPDAIGAIGAFGDGTILQDILDFFNSQLGQMIIKLLLAFLMGA